MRETEKRKVRMPTEYEANIRNLCIMIQQPERDVRLALFHTELTAWQVAELIGDERCYFDENVKRFVIKNRSLLG